MEEEGDQLSSEEAAGGGHPGHDKTTKGGGQLVGARVGRLAAVAAALSRDPQRSVSGIERLLLRACTGEGRALEMAARGNPCPRFAYKAE